MSFFYNTAKLHATKWLYKEDIMNMTEARLKSIVNNIGPRMTGTENNRKMMDFLKTELTDLAIHFTSQPFPCIEWYYKEGILRIDNCTYPFLINPMSKSVEITAPAVRVSTMLELVACNCQNKILIIDEELTESEYFPLSFPFYQIDGQKETVLLLMEKSPACVIAISHKKEKVAPLFNDADFLIPSITVSQPIGTELIEKAIIENKEIEICLSTLSTPSMSENIVATINPECKNRILLSSHTDTHFLSPGALDNATGVVCMLGLIETLSQIKEKCIEFVFFNSEDYYSAAGEVVYLKELQHKEDIKLVINIDGMGFAGEDTGISLYGTDEDTSSMVESFLNNTQGFVLAAQWYQGDHMIFFQQEIPCLAVCSLEALESTYEILHTDRDKLEAVDYSIIKENIDFITTLINAL